METCMWCVVCILLTVRLVNDICSLFVDLTVTRLTHFYVYILRIMLWSCLHSVYCVLLYLLVVQLTIPIELPSLSIFIHLILCKKEQYKCVPYFKIIKHLKTVAYLVRNNPITQYNSASIILLLYNSSITFIIILQIAIRLINGKHVYNGKCCNCRVIYHTCIHVFL